MLSFPNCKINLGLNVTEKRADGFHNIETVFFAVNWCDALEIIEGGEEAIEIIRTGLSIDVPIEQNIIYKAWKLVTEQVTLPPVKVFIHKVLPMGAGLGGGSSNAAFFLKLINEKFNLNFSQSELKEMASRLGSDCAFFIENKTVFASGKGDIFEPLNIDLSSYYILLVYPNVHSNTKEAYDGISPHFPASSVKEIVSKEPVHKWKDVLTNDFEKSIFKKYPAISELKDTLYSHGAVYASMSGSGSTVFGIFDKKPTISFPGSYSTFLQEPKVV